MKSCLLMIAAASVFSCVTSSMTYAQGITTQDAELESASSTVEVKVTAFPHNPEVVIYKDQIFVANSPVIQYGSNKLFYHLANGIERK